MPFSQCWSLLEKIVKARNPKREVVKYKYIEELWEKIYDDDIKLIFLRAPTGIGKTEAVIIPFLYQYLNDDFKWWSLVYVLPTRSLVVNMYRRFCKTISYLFNPPFPLNVLLDYGSPLIVKPYLEGDVVVTTYDTLIYTMYGLRSWGRHYRLPLAKLSNSIIILDEVQLMQDIYWYSPFILSKHVSFLTSIAPKIIIMSATLPKEIEKSIINEVKSRNKEIGIATINSEDIARRGKLKVSLEKRSIEECLKEIIENDVLNYVPLLVVCNTVGKAIELYDKFYEPLKKYGLRVELLHSRLRYCVRKNREIIFEKNIGTNLVLFSTQVVEAGIDYNFKTIITEIAPIDSLIQRLGRGARRVGIEGSAYVIINNDTINRAKRVYGDKIIERSQTVIAISSEKKFESAIKDSKAASSLVDEQYTEELINSLFNKYKELSEYRASISSFISKVSGNLLMDKKVLEELYKNYLKYLVRLGIELKALLPSDEIKMKVKEVILKGELSISIDDKLIEENMVRLSLRNISKESLPDAITFKHDKNEYVIIVDYINSKLVAQNLSQVYNKRLYSLITSKILLLNPEYYLFKDSYDLGVVRL